jgi:CrcB protein
MSNFSEYLLIFIGGGLGSILRFGLGKWITVSFPSLFPWGTWWVNFLGSLLIGIIITYTTKHPHLQHYKLFLATGFCGGFTTFSTFSYENWSLWTKGDYFTSFIYTSSSVFLGIMAAMFGAYLLKE